MFLPLNQAPSSDDGLKHRPEPQRACSLLLRPADRAIYLLKASLVRAAGGGKGAQRRATVLLQTTGGRAAASCSVLEQLDSFISIPLPWHLQHPPVSPGEEEPMQGTGRSGRLCPGGSVLLHPQQG